MVYLESMDEAQAVTKNEGYILKVALFATGLSGIVAEYILATLATYFLGDSVFQWTLIISLMLFFMGLGSRLTQFISDKLFTYFIVIELTLSATVAFSALLTYSMAAFSNYTGLFIYSTAMLTGTLIGMELPIAIRLNEKNEALKINVSSILEKDYYGSLLGGLFFAFIGLPYLGLTYTPFILGLVNLLVAIGMLFYYKINVEKRKLKWLKIAAFSVLIIIGTGLINAQKIILYGEQHKYLDKVVLSKQSAYQKIVLTQWKSDFWLYLNGNLQFSSFDEELYHEVLVHPAVQLAQIPREVLILGGGDGCAARELLKYEAIEKITLVDLDPAVTTLATEHPILTRINKGALADPKVEVVNSDGFHWLENNNRFFDLIIIDLPDPRSVELARLYSLQFYQLCARQLRPNGALITQAGSPYFAPRSFKCILKTMQAAGFSAIPMHNQIVTMGEWGWVLGTKAVMNKEEIISSIKEAKLENLPTKWLNNEAIDLITSFGKDFFMNENDSIRINQIQDPVIQRYFLNGTWELY